MKSIMTRIGGASWRASSSHTGQIQTALVGRSERLRSSEDIAADLRRKLADIPGITIRTRAGQGLFILRIGSSGGDEVEVEIRGHDLETADALSQEVLKVVEETGGISDAKVSRESGRPEEVVIIDREKAADMKLTVSDIANALQTIISGTQAGYFRELGDEFVILVKISEAEKMNLRDILDLTLTNSDGELVVLRNVVEINPRSGPVQIDRKDQERVVTISGNISGRDMGSVLGEIGEKLRSMPTPKGFSIRLGGDYEEQQKAFSELLLSCILALVLVYMVMACQYES
ncbi:MAG: efflux RND transporter permease subunit, partial [Candidatus Brocadiia bacterium]